MMRPNVFLTLRPSRLFRIYRVATAIPPITLAVVNGSGVLPPSAPVMFGITQKFHPANRYPNCIFCKAVFNKIVPCDLNDPSLRTFFLFFRWNVWCYGRAELAKKTDLFDNYSNFTTFQLFGISELLPPSPSVRQLLAPYTKNVGGVTTSYKCNPAVCPRSTSQHNRHKNPGRNNPRWISTLSWLMSCCPNRFPGCTAYTCPRCK